MAHPNSLKNLRKGQLQGKRGPTYDQKKVRSEVSLTPESKAKLRGPQCPFRGAGYKSLSQFVELALRGAVQVPPASSALPPDSDS